MKTNMFISFPDLKTTKNAILQNTEKVLFISKGNKFGMIIIRNCDLIKITRCLNRVDQIDF